MSFWAWAVLYVAAPLLLPVLWARNRRYDPGDAVRTRRVPDGLRKLVGAVGVVQGAAALAFYVHPPLVIDWWPWQLSPLTTRTIFSFFGFIAVVWLAFLWEDRWSALRLHVETATLGLVLVGLGAFRATEDLTGSPAMVALVFGLLAATVVGAVALYLSMQRSVPWSPGRVPGLALTTHDESPVSVGPLRVSGRRTRACARRTVPRHHPEVVPTVRALPAASGPATRWGSA